MNLIINSKPSISILMANYNKGAYIEDAIQSVLNQDFDNWELIIFDDASTDDSLIKIKKFADERIKLISNRDNNKGYIGALKEMISEANGEIVIILDSDDALAPNALSEIAKIYQNHPEYDFVYTQCYYCDERLKPIHLGYSARIPEGNTNLHNNSVVAMRTFRKTAYLKTTGYCEQMLYAEDVDLTFKIEEIGKLYFLDKPLYYYRILKGSQTHSFCNELINRSSTSLARLNAYKRRIGTNIPNLSKVEISEVLFWGIFSSLLVKRLNLVKQFSKELLGIHPYFLIDYKFYSLIFKKIIKIVRIKFNSIKFFKSYLCFTL